MSKEEPQEIAIVSSDELVKRLNAGVLEESERGTLLKMLQISLASSLIGNTHKVDENVVQMNSLLEKVNRRYVELVYSSLESYNLEELTDILNSLVDRQLKVADLQRKVLQGKELISGEVLSDDERKILKVMSSFTSKEEKRAFLNAVQEHLNEIESKRDAKDEFRD